MKKKIKPDQQEDTSKYYLRDEEVEPLIKKYHERGCTDVIIRDEIMKYAERIIPRVIYTHNLHKLYGGGDDSSFGDLYQIAWKQLESALYKLDLKPGHSKIFNMWSQIVRTVILAAIKKNNKDRKNADNYRNHLDIKFTRKKYDIERFVKEANDIFKYCSKFREIIKAISHIYYHDEKPHDNLIQKIEEHTQIPRIKIELFFKTINAFRDEFNDTPESTDENVVKPTKMLWVLDEN